MRGKGFLYIAVVVFFCLVLRAADDGGFSPTNGESSDAETMVASGDSDADSTSAVSAVSGSDFSGSDFHRKRGEKKAVTEFKRYTVKKGDTLYSVARKFGISVGEIADLNGFSKTAALKAGQRIKIPSEEKISTAVSKPLSTESSFCWPVGRVISVSKGDVSCGNIGIFIKSRPGASVYSAADGTVSRVGYMRGYGKYIVITHGGRYVTVYSMISPLSLKNGRKVKRGEPIGSVDGESSQIHFQINRAGKPVDAVKLLPSRS